MKILPVFLPYAGCKHRCVFCDQPGATGKTKKLAPEDLNSLLLEYLKTSSEYEVAFYGGTFTGLSIDEQDAYLKTLEKWIKRGVVKGIRISTRPDEINEEIARFLKERGVTVVEVGVQSMDDRVLGLSRRGHTSDDSRKAIYILRKYEFVVGTHLMVGLPGSSKERDIYSALEVSRLRVDTARVHPTLVFKGAKLYEMYRSGKYIPLSLEEAVDITAEMVMIFEAQGVKVIRIGLHVPVEQRVSIVAGPYHPSFGELVRVAVVKKLVEELQIKSIVVDERRKSWVFGHGTRSWMNERGVEVVLGDEMSFDGIVYEEALKTFWRRRGYW